MEITQTEPPQGMQLESFFCNTADAILHVQDRSFPVHRFVLATNSRYFYILFYNEFTNNHNKREYTIPGVDASIMELLLCYMYGHPISITKENVCDLYMESDQFSIFKLVSRCTDFICKHIDVENVISVFNLGRNTVNHVLEISATEFILANFSEISNNSSEYLNLKTTELKSFLDSSWLNLNTEELVFDSIVRWVDFDPQNRLDHINTLLGSLRLGPSDERLVKSKIAPHPYVEKQEEKDNLMDKLMLACKLGSPSSSKRIPHDVIFFIGERIKHSDWYTLCMCDPRSLEMKIVPGFAIEDFEDNRLAVLDELIYIIGGLSGNAVNIINLVLGTYSCGPPLNVIRYGVTVGVLDGCVYAMGGFFRRTYERSVERYSRYDNQWRFISAMHRRRRDASASALNGKIYICGGEEKYKLISSCEFYEPSSNQWTLISDMLHPRGDHGVISYKGCLYVIGGFTDMARITTSTERYEPGTNQWSPCASLNIPRSNFGLEVIDNKILVVGGFDELRVPFDAEYYENGKWKGIESFKIGTCNPSICLIRNISKYFWIY